MATVLSGYVTGWGSTPYAGNEVIVNGTTRRATSFSSDGRVASPRIIQLGNGTKVSYDPTAATVVETRVTQELFDTAGSTFAVAMRELLGTVGTLEMSHDPAGTGLALDTVSNSEAMLIEVIDRTPVDGSRSRTWVSLTWEILGTWT